jgi:hypothetical protein
MTITKPRPYLNDRHLKTMLDAPNGGCIEIRPLRATEVHIDIAKSNSMPANERTTRNGSQVLNIGQGVEIRASANVELIDGAWKVKPRTLYASQYPSRRDLTAAQQKRARALIEELIGSWANAHAGDLAQADDIDRNNAARRLEEEIAAHEQALAILREQLSACEEGEPFTQYPDLPTKR